MKTEPRLLTEFKRRWRKIKSFEEDEVRKLSLQQKLLQTASLIRMGRGLQLDFYEDKEKLKVRSRWIFLKKSIT